MGDFEPAASRVKWLRQGRGNGFRDALRVGDSAAGDVLGCVLDDPRWDRQVEQRDAYYARLLLALDADIRALEERVLDEGPRDEADFWLPIGVLAEMARRGHARAGNAIATAIRRGLRWRACLDALNAAGGEPLIGAVVRAEDVEAMIGRIDLDGLVRAVQTVAAPWTAWATEVPGLRFVWNAGTSREAQPDPMCGPVSWVASRLREPANPPLNPNLATADLFEFAATPGASRQVETILRTRSDETTVAVLRNMAIAGTPAQRTIALGILGERGYRDFVEDAVHFLSEESRVSEHERKEHGTRRAFLRYLERLPADITLEQARRWFLEPWPLSLAGEHILIRHATRDDRVTLEEAGAAALDSGEMYRLCSVVDALASIGAVESLPFLSLVPFEAPYSCVRRRALSALVPHIADDVARSLIVEALWDCEAESRILACGAAPTMDICAARRLSEIANDAFEAQEVRLAAQAGG
jgi:hypothetical protein